jgi:hypothetical protein
MNTRDVLTMVTLTLSAAACDAGAANGKDSVAGEKEGISIPTEAEVSSVSQALDQRHEVYRSFRDFGGNILPQEHTFLVGGPCSGDNVRSPPVSAFFDGNGYCNFDRWENSGNEHDCTARIHAHTDGGWGGGRCQIVVYDEPVRAKPGSCLNGPSNFCGGPSSTGSCYCDPACVSYGDCCRDFTRVCPPIN